MGRTRTSLTTGTIALAALIGVAVVAWPAGASADEPPSSECPREDVDGDDGQMSLLEGLTNAVEMISAASLIQSPLQAAAASLPGTGVLCRPGFTFDGVGCWPDDPTRGTGPSSTLLLLARSWYLVTTIHLPSPDAARVAVAPVDDGRTHPGFASRVERPPRA
jgi:hypothetical protein